ncbi:MAG: DNA adenine methylase [Lachnospiraceae bacterium]|nr:DNA adenine methylase [Lachnospiraceae bacterium]
MEMKEKEVRLSPLLKYPGGKEKELKFILPNLPKGCKNYYEPFVGGGAVYFSLDSGKYYINDKSTELINLYHMIKTQNEEFLEKLNAIDRNWMTMEEIIENHTEELVPIYFEYKKDEINAVQLSDAISEFVFRNAEEFNGLLSRSFNIAIENFVIELNKSFKNKIIRMKKLEAQKGDLQPGDIVLNLECAFKNAFYMHFRYLYNHIEEFSISVPFATAIYFFVREFCYASMFRYNRQGKFNVPYGGISYNKKSLMKKAQYFENGDLVKQLQNTVIENMDFEDFIMIHPPEKNDFIFLDPPYDTEFSTYAQNEFGKQDQIRLAEFLLYRCRAEFMLIIKNTDFIRGLYPRSQKTANGKELRVGKFDKKYVVSFQDRNDKDVEHLLITNYQI